MLKAKDIMSKDVITVRPSATLEELAKVLVAHDISGVPVVDENGDLMGIVTENDLISHNKKLHIPTIMRLFDAFIMLESPSRVEREMKKMAAITVGEICTREVVTVSEGSAVEDIATIMAERNIHHIPVVSGRRILGIIGKMDLIKGMVRK